VLVGFALLLPEHPTAIEATAMTARIAAIRMHPPAPARGALLAHGRARRVLLQAAMAVVSGSAG
jgi:hypothetical protein